VNFLREAPPQVLVIIDADCLIEAGALDTLIRAAQAAGRPAQAVYLMASPPEPGVKDHLSAFAFLTKNLVRPRGLDRLGSPVLLTGTGMAFPWDSIADIPLASGNIVEDMQLGVDLALRGRPPMLCVDARVNGQLPAGEKTALTQRKRWEHGHLRTLLTQAPRLMMGAMGFRPSLLILAADLLIPPLALLAMLWVAVFGMVAAGWFFLPHGGILVPLAVHVGVGALFFLSTGLIWYRFGRGSIPLFALTAVPVYMLWKLPLYVRFLFRPERQWIRTERPDSSPPTLPNLPSHLGQVTSGKNPPTFPS